MRLTFTNYDGYSHNVKDTTLIEGNPSEIMDFVSKLDVYTQKDLKARLVTAIGKGRMILDKLDELSEGIKEKD